jgi:hypothetical protein
MDRARYTDRHTADLRAHIVKPDEGGLYVPDDTSRTAILLRDIYHPGYSQTVQE